MSDLLCPNCKTYNIPEGYTDCRHCGHDEGHRGSTALRHEVDELRAENAELRRRLIAMGSVITHTEEAGDE